MPLPHSLPRLRRVWLAALLLPALHATAAPLYQSRLLFEPESWHNHASCVVELPNGDLLACWFHGSGERTADDVKVEGARLRRGASAWGPRFTLADTPGFPDCNPAMFLDPQGRLWLVWITIQSNRWESSLLKYQRSEDFLVDGAPRWNDRGVIHLKPPAEFAAAALAHYDRVEPSRLAAAADDDEDGATLHAMAECRQPGTSEQEIALALHVLDGVPREALEPIAELFAGRPRRLGDRRRRERDPDGDDTIIHDDAVALDAHRCAVGDLAESERPDPIDEWDTCLREDGGAEVRVAPRDRRGGVHDRGGARGHERFRRNPVEVLVIDDRHIARSEPLDEPFRAGPDARQCLGLDGSARAPRTRPDHHSASRRASRRGRGGSAYRAALSGRSPRRSASSSPLRR